MLGYYFFKKFIFSGLVILKNNCVQQSSILSKLSLLHSLTLQFCSSSCFEEALLFFMQQIYDSEGKKNLKPKSNQYIFINETRLCRSLASPLILQANPVYNNQISFGCFCANKGGTQEDRALQAQPLSAPTWDGLFWSVNQSLAHCSWSSEFQSSKCLYRVVLWEMFFILWRSGWALVWGCTNQPHTLFIPGLLFSFYGEIHTTAAEKGLEKSECSFLRAYPTLSATLCGRKFQWHLEIPVHPIVIFLPLVLFSLPGLNPHRSHLTEPTWNPWRSCP